MLGERVKGWGQSFGVGFIVAFFVVGAIFMTYTTIETHEVVQQIHAIQFERAQELKGIIRDDRDIIRAALILVALEHAVQTGHTATYPLLREVCHVLPGCVPPRLHP